MKVRININTTASAGYAVIEVFSASFAYEPVSASSYPLPPVVSFIVNVPEVRLDDVIAGPIERRAA